MDRRSSSMLVSITVPGDTMRVISRFTSPLAVAGSSICSQMATLYPFSMSFARYTSTAWKGTPHMGARSLMPQSFPVRVSSSSRDTSFASSKNIS